MKIHLSKDKKEIFSEKELKKIEVPFSFESIETMDSALSKPNINIDPRTVIELLDYIDYDKFINKDSESDYYKYLNYYENEFFTYLMFKGISDSLLNEYYKNRNGIRDTYHYSKFYFQDSGLKLMSYFLDISDVPILKNKFIEFKMLEEKLKNVSGDNRKIAMMIAFTYRPYPNSDFYNSFDDLELTRDDIIAFVNEYEESGEYLDIRQLDNLLISYRNRYLIRNGLFAEYNQLEQQVQDEFREYRKTRYAFFPNDFIEYYNSKHPTANFGSLISTDNSLLTSDIYDLIINQNNLIGFDALFGSKAYNNYIYSKKIKSHAEQNSSEVYKKKLNTYEKYYELLNEQNFSLEFTIDYFIRKNIPQEDLEMFLDFKNWFDQYCPFSWDYSKRVQERTLRQLQADFYQELRKTPFEKRNVLLKAYNEYLVSDKLSEFTKVDAFSQILSEYESEIGIAKEHSSTGQESIRALTGKITPDINLEPATGKKKEKTKKKKTILIIVLIKIVIQLIV